MTIDIEVSVTRAICGMKKIDSLRKSEQDIGLRLRPSARTCANFLGESFVKRGDAATFALESGAQCFKCGAIIPFQISERSQDFRRKRRARIVLGLLDQVSE